ncbi:serine/threonine protein kinase [bacterium]|jgi:eukaryotic-like serine/threonine-protein kinase|nr:serine/threonine protein kinase [bacterium]
MVPCGGCGAKVFIPADLAPLATTPCSKCEEPIMMPMMLRQFNLLRPIAEGGMGIVYRAFDTTLEREVAVKLMKEEFSEDKEVLEGFYREARACACLNHPNIIHIYTFDEWENMRYLVMEVADNGSLDGRIEAYKSLDELSVLDAGIKVASALESALGKNLLHRDLKPANILFNQENEPKLVDFGLAVNADADPNFHGAVWGTPYYIAPEKVNREAETFLSDMYSLAGTLYHALTGHVPFEAPTIEEVVSAHVHTALTPANHVVQSITQPTSDAIFRAMDKVPAQRFQSYGDFIMAMESARSQLLVNQMSSSAAPVAPAANPGGGKGWWRR